MGKNLRVQQKNKNKILVDMLAKWFLTLAPSNITRFMAILHGIG